MRARINVLSEVPQKWKECLTKWHRHNKEHKEVVEGQTVPDRNEEYLLYQTLIGAWPMIPVNENEYGLFKARIGNYMLKAVREAKVNTSWISPNTAYEEALMRFIETAMADRQENLFLADFMVFQKMVSQCGIFNSLSEAVLKITCPGVPDFYQGTELWDFSLVDPDNRRPVDYDTRINRLKKLKQRNTDSPLESLAAELIAHKEDGVVKLYVINKALNYRRDRRKIFEKGEYIPLEAGGSKADNVCAFVRKLGDDTVFVAIPRFFTKLVRHP